MKKIIFVVLAVFSLLLLTSCSQKENKTPATSSSQKTTTSSSNQEKYNETAIPTVYFHGYSGTERSLGGMIERLHEKKLTTREMLIHVAVDGQLAVEGSLSGKKNNPSIQVLFDDNRNNEWNQTEWVHNVMTYLKNQGVEKVNIVTHSMGGVSTMRYLVTYGQATDVPAIEKFIPIAAPFNNFLDTTSQQTIAEELKDGPTQEVDRYIFYRDRIKNVPSSIQFLTIAGKLSQADFSDGTVPTTSALALNALLTKNGNKVTYEIFTGAAAEHSRLHENPQVDEAVANFLWKK